MKRLDCDTDPRVWVWLASGSNSTGLVASSEPRTQVSTTATYSSSSNTASGATTVKYMGTGPTNEHEITFFELSEHADQDDPEGRVGFRPDGCNDTDGSPIGGLEFNMTKGPGGEYLDGEEQSFTNHGIAVDEVLADGSFRYLKSGAQTYGSNNTGPLLLHDVGVSTTRMACP